MSALHCVLYECVSVCDIDTAWIILPSICNLRCWRGNTQKHPASWESLKGLGRSLSITLNIEEYFWLFEILGDKAWRTSSVPQALAEVQNLGQRQRYSVLSASVQHPWQWKKTSTHTCGCCSWIWSGSLKSLQHPEESCSHVNSNL